MARTGGQSEKWKWLVQPRQAKGEWARKAHFAHQDHLTFDLEGLATAIRQSEKWKWLVQPRPAKGEWAKKALFTFLTI